jgi:L-alanine-DL-glutamate epimerase-like enolase superfamily enzyme
MLTIKVDLDRWDLKEPFAIARLTFYASLIATVRIRDAHGNEGVGECEPHEWDEDASRALIAGVDLVPGEWCQPGWAENLDRENLGDRLPRSALRNAIDCALWDLDAKRRGIDAGAMAGKRWEPVTVMPTIGINTPERMAQIATSFDAPGCVKVKLGATDGLDAERMQAISTALPGVPLLIDVNTGWTPEMLAAMLPIASRCNVRIVEQPLPPALDEMMPTPPTGIQFCADESCLDRSSLPRVSRHFQYINIKLDKAGGLSEALALREEAERLGMGVMVGMMSGTSLAVAPASLLAQGLKVVDLELGFLVRDREPPMHIENNKLLPPLAALWG